MLVWDGLSNQASRGHSWHLCSIILTQSYKEYHFSSSSGLHILSSDVFWKLHATTQLQGRHYYIGAKCTTFFQLKLLNINNILSEILFSWQIICTVVLLTLEQRESCETKTIKPSKIKHFPLSILLTIFFFL